MSDLPEHARANREHWNETARDWVARGEQAWASSEPYWGIWGHPEAELGLLPADMSGLDAIDLGCGTGYVCAWMARRGAHAVGIDIAEQQLETARRLAREHEVDVTLICGSAESVPRPDASFDFAFSEYGAALWCDPFVWIPEAHRLLRPGGQLVFLCPATLLALCTPDSAVPATPSLKRDYFDLHRLDFRHIEDDPGGIEFYLPVPEWLRLFRRVGFELCDYLEPPLPATASGEAFGVSADWARRWPSEQVFKLRRRAASLNLLSMSGEI